MGCKRQGMLFKDGRGISSRSEEGGKEGMRMGKTKWHAKSDGTVANATRGERQVLFDKSRCRNGEERTGEGTTQKEGRRMTDRTLGRASGMSDHQRKCRRQTKRTGKG